MTQQGGRILSRFETAFPIILAMSGVLICACIFSYRSSINQVESLFDTKGNSISDFVQQAAAPYIVNYDVTNLQKFVDFIQRDPQVVFAAIYDEKSLITENSKVPSDMSSVILYERPILNLEKKQVGTLKVGYARAVFQETLVKTLVSTILLVLIAGTVLALAIFWTFMRLAKSARAIAKGLLSSSDELGQTSTAVERAANALWAGSQEQNTALDETQQAMEILFKYVGDTHDTVAKTSAMARESEISVQKGQEAIQIISGALAASNLNTEAMAKGYDGVRSRMGEIKTMMNSIHDKTQIINEIVFQTRLLSFNASVEAARAGEKGKGFSIVAEEIGKLAKVSGSAAADIGSILVESSKRVEDIAQAIGKEVQQFSERSSDSIVENKGTIEQSMKAFEQISSHAKRSVMIAEEIAQLTSNQTVGLEQISKAISKMTETLSKTVKISQESSEASTVLSKQADNIRSITAMLGHLLGISKKLQAAQNKRRLDGDAKESSPVKRAA